MREHERWLEFAKRDLNDARLLYKGKSYPSAAYHCQQAAEKSLKAYLAFNNQEILKTHDLIKLNDLCQKFDNSFQKLSTELKMLNPFATKFRYPSEFDLPDSSETTLAIKQANTILTLVVKKIANPMGDQLEIR